MSNFLEQLAMEADVVENPETGYSSDETVGDLIESNQLPVQPADMIQHAEKARDIADKLDELADKADELADEDQQYTGASLESLVREYGVINTVAELQYAPQSFESEYRPSSRAKQLAVDARRAADHLRNNAGRMDELSVEGLSMNPTAMSLFSIFVDKDKAINKAHVVLQREMGALKGVATALKNEGVVLQHEGIARFLLVKGEETRDLPAQIKFEADYLKGVKKYIDDRIHEVSSATPGQQIKPGDVSLVNTSTGTKHFNLHDVSDYPMLGNYGVFNFTLLERAGLAGKGSVGGVLGVSLKGGVASLATYIVVGGVLGAGIAPGVVAGLAAADAVGRQGRQKTLDKSDIATSITVDQLNTSVNTVLGLGDYAKTDALYNQVKELESKLKELKGQDKALYKQAMDELNLVKKALTILKDRVFYLTTQLARLLEQTVRKSK